MVDYGPKLPPLAAVADSQPRPGPARLCSAQPVFTGENYELNEKCDSHGDGWRSVAAQSASSACLVLRLSPKCEKNQANKQKKKQYVFVAGVKFNKTI